MTAISVAPSASLSTEEEFVSKLLHGKSTELTNFIRKPSEDVAREIVAAVAVLESTSRRITLASGCGVHALLESGIRTSANELAEELGVTKSRVSQVRKVGAVVAALGLPEGWKSPVADSDLIAVCSGNLPGSKDLTEVLGAKLPLDRKRQAVAQIVENGKAEQARKAAAKDAQAIAGKATTATGEEGDSNAPEVSDAPEGEESNSADVFAYSKAATGSHVAALVEACGYLAHNFARLTAAQRKTVMSALDVLGTTAEEAAKK